MRTPKQRATLGETEEGTQQAIIQALRVRGYAVLQTTVRLRAGICQCGRKVSSPGKYGSDKGISDLLIWIAAIGGWMMMEVKGPTTKVSCEQQDAVNSGRMVIVRSVDEAFAAIKEWERPLTSDPSNRDKD